MDIHFHIHIHPEPKESLNDIILNNLHTISTINTVRKTHIRYDPYRNTRTSVPFIKRSKDGFLPKGLI